MTTATTTVPVAATDGDETCDVLHLHVEGIRTLRPALIAPGLATTLAETFRALGDPTRVRILDALSRAELCVCDIAALLSISESAISHQLRLLRSLRLVRSRRAGRMVFYALDDDHITRLFAQGLEHVEEAMSPSRREALAGTGR
jgi:ArsR family transcriptional regulator, lead/cadmium/zinc/bismuth-responsive transcriptional repressor